jgi:electron transfer flavoprotein alpha subunit
VPLPALVLGPGAAGTAAHLGRYGVDVVHAGYEDAASYAPRARAHAVVDVMSASDPEVVLGPGTDRGNEIVAFAAAMAELPMAANCVSVTPGDPYQLSRLRWAGSLVEEATLGGSGPKLVTVAPSTIVAEPAPAALTPEMRTVDLQPDERDQRVVVGERLQPSADGISLTDARVVVGGGRGVGGRDGFGPLEELAALLGGTVGVSRVVTSEGWRPHRDQVGQTGTRIAPELYIACGISGAIQHMDGCKGAKHILAINSDPNAPIMSKADFTVVGDLHAVLPAIIAAVRDAQEIAAAGR